MLETSFRVRWRKIVEWVDKEVFKEEDIYEVERFNIAKKNSEYILSALSTWYNKIYLNWEKESFVNIPLRTFKRNILIEDKASIIMLGNPITCVSINKEIHSSKKDYYSDIELKTLAWLTSKELKCEEVIIQSISLGKKGRVDINDIFYDKASLEKVEVYIENICKIINNRLYYPSVSKECSECNYYENCNP